MNSFKWRLSLPFLLLAVSLACSTVAKYLPPAVTILAAPAKSATWDAASLQQASEIVTARLRLKATGKFSVQVTSDNQISVALEDTKDLAAAQSLITEAGVVIFADTKNVIPIGDELKSAEKVILTQADVHTARAQESTYDNYEVAFTLNPAGTKKLADYTRENVGHFLAIARDGRVVSCPLINGEIVGGEGIITGIFGQQEAEELAALLIHPPLPFPLVVVKVNRR